MVLSKSIQALEDFLAIQCSDLEYFSRVRWKEIKQLRLRGGEKKKQKLWNWGDVKKMITFISYIFAFFYTKTTSE